FPVIVFEDVAQRIVTRSGGGNEEAPSARRGEDRRHLGPVETGIGTAPVAVRLRPLHFFHHFLGGEWNYLALGGSVLCCGSRSILVWKLRVLFLSPGPARAHRDDSTSSQPDRDHPCSRHTILLEGFPGEVWKKSAIGEILP